MQGHHNVQCFSRVLAKGLRDDGELKKALTVMHQPISLLDVHGKISERYRLFVEKAGRDGYPAKPCVPLFTALCYGPGDIILSGGHPLDPFLRIYDVSGHLQHSLPWRGNGGQQVAAVPAKDGGQIFAVLSENGCVVRLSLDGHMVGLFGRPLTYDLAQISSLTADEHSGSVYAITRAGTQSHLLRFATSGRFLWALPLIPPAGLAKAQPIFNSLITQMQCKSVLWH